MPGDDVLALAALGAGQIGLGLVFLTIGARLIPAAQVALITLLEVVLGPLWVWLAIDEKPSTATLRRRRDRDRRGRDPGAARPRAARPRDDGAVAGALMAARAGSTSRRSTSSPTRGAWRGSPRAPRSAAGTASSSGTTSSTRAPVRGVADPWVTLSAVACATERVRIGPMVTPPSRRRVQKLTREAVTLDHLSGGRLVLGLGLGSDRHGELAPFGDVDDPREQARAARRRARAARPRSGTASSSRARCRRPRIPIWLAARWPRKRPIRRAARWDGVFPIDLPGPDAVAELVADVAELRGPDAAPFDVVVTNPPGPTRPVGRRGRDLVSHRARLDAHGGRRPRGHRRRPFTPRVTAPPGRPGSCPPTAPAGRGHQPRTPGGRMERAGALR